MEKIFEANGSGGGGGNSEEKGFKFWVEVDLYKTDSEK